MKFCIRLVPVCVVDNFLFIFGFYLFRLNYVALSLYFLILYWFEIANFVLWKLHFNFLRNLIIKYILSLKLLHPDVLFIFNVKNDNKAHTGNFTSSLKTGPPQCWTVHGRHGRQKVSWLGGVVWNNSIPPGWFWFDSREKDWKSLFPNYHHCALVAASLVLSAFDHDSQLIGLCKGRYVNAI